MMMVVPGRHHSITFVASMKCDYCPPKCYTEFPACFQLYSGSCQKGNPGNVQDLHKLSLSIMPKFFDGLEVDYLHRLATNKMITSNWVLSNKLPSGFRFGGVYSMRLHQDMMYTPTIHADINPTTLASNVNIVYYPFTCLRTEVSLQRMDGDFPLSTQITAEWCRPCTTLTANLYNVRQDSGRGTLSFMRQVTDRWAFGSELLLEWNEPKQMMADVALAARYSRHNYSLATTVSRQALDISYWQRIHERIQMTSILAWNRRTNKTIAKIGYQWNFEEATVRGMLDSDLAVGFEYNRFLSDLPMSVGMSLFLRLPTNSFVFGLKFNLNPSGLRRGA